MAFVEAAVTGGDPSAFVLDPDVGHDAVEELRDRRDYRGPHRFGIHPTYVDPLSQGDPAGTCQLTGDVTSTCAVQVLRPGLNEPDAESLVLIFMSRVSPESPVNEPVVVGPHVVGFEFVARTTP